jgi:autotransporter-associated beta strand protein
MPSQRVQSLTTVGDDLYFAFFTNASASKPESRYPGIYLYDAEGRLSKVVNRTQRAAALGSVNTVFDRLQSRSVAVTGTSGTFSATQILYRENAVSSVAGATAFKPVDFNRDNAVTAADLALLAPQVTIRGQVKTNVADLTFDMNGNDTVDWKDVQIVEGFLNYVADPALAGRVVPTLPIQADADLNGVVDFNDFLVMRANYGTASQGFVQGDFSGDNQVDFADLQPWVNSYGFRSGVVGTGVPMAAFDTAVWNQFLGGLTAPAVTLDVASGRQTQFQKGYRAIVIAASVAKTGTGTLVMDGPNTFTGQTNVAAGTLEIAHPLALATSTLQVASGATATVAPYLATTVKGLDLSAGGRLDVGNGMVTVTSGLSVANMVAAIVVGQSGGSGITSSAVAAANAAGDPRAIGWLDNGDGSVTFAFAAPGDTNLDGQIDVLDAASLSGAARFNDTAVWSEGDFNYDGIYDDLDNALYVSTGLFDAGPYNAPPGAAGAIAPVPEPALGAWGLAGLAAAGFIRRARRCAVAPRGVMRRPAA